MEDPSHDISGKKFNINVSLIYNIAWNDKNQNDIEEQQNYTNKTS